MNFETVPIEQNQPASELAVGIGHPLKTNNCNQLHQLLPEGGVNKQSFGKISFEGLPQGSRPDKVMRCIQLLEHVPGCGWERGGCPEGEECVRTKLVLNHHSTCRNTRRDGNGNCNICHQLLALCRNHSQHCQAKKGHCEVLYCKNQNVKVVPKWNQIQPKPYPAEETRREYQYVVGKLTAAMALPTKPQKLREIERLLETNRQATAQVLRYVTEKRQKSQPAPLSYKMENLAFCKGFKPTIDKSVRRALNPKIQFPVLTCLLKLDVAIKVA